MRRTDTETGAALLVGICGRGRRRQFGEMHVPANLQMIGDEIAIAWDDGKESYFPAERLRAASPSAETQGERDILGVQHGGHPPRAFPGVRVLAWELVGNYAVRFDFSDGHRTGIYSFDYLRKLDGLD